MCQFSHIPAFLGARFSGRQTAASVSVADRMSRASRSRIMASVRQKDTVPEMLVRQGLHRLGFRYRLHDKSLPGRPDIVLPRFRAVIFVNGCFWHAHGCRKTTIPAMNAEFWRAKIERNMQRDAEAIDKLHMLGWRSLTIWECAVRTSPDVCSTAVATAADWLRSEGR